MTDSQSGTNAPDREVIDLLAGAHASVGELFYLINTTADPLVVLVTVVAPFPTVSVKTTLRLTDPSVSPICMV